MIRGKVLMPLSVKAGNANATAELDFNPHLIRPLPQPPLPKSVPSTSCTSRLQSHSLEPVATGNQTRQVGHQRARGAWV